MAEWLKEHTEFKSKREYDSYFGHAPRGNLNSFVSGPYGLGDPSDKTLNYLEKRYGLIFKRREIITSEFCSEADEAYTSCGQRHPFTKWYTCSDATKNRRSCIDMYWNTPGLEQRAKNEYLHSRTLFRNTGLMKHERDKTERDPVLLLGFMRMKSYEAYKKTTDLGFWSAVLELFKDESEWKAVPKDEQDTDLSETN